MRRFAAIIAPKCRCASAGVRNRLAVTSFSYSECSRTPCTTNPRISDITNMATTDKTNVLFMSPPAYGAPLAGAAGAHHTSRHGPALGPPAGDRRPGVRRPGAAVRGLPRERPLVRAGIPRDGARGGGLGGVLRGDPQVGRALHDPGGRAPAHPGAVSDAQGVLVALRMRR